MHPQPVALPGGDPGDRPAPPAVGAPVQLDAALRVLRPPAEKKFGSENDIRKPSAVKGSARSPSLKVTSRPTSALTASGVKRGELALRLGDEALQAGIVELRLHLGGTNTPFFAASIAPRE